jgi:hypothetical protein
MAASLAYGSGHSATEGIASLQMMFCARRSHIETSAWLPAYMKEFEYTSEAYKAAQQPHMMGMNLSRWPPASEDNTCVSISSHLHSPHIVRSTAGTAALRIYDTVLAVESSHPHLCGSFHLLFNFFLHVQPAFVRASSHTQPQR